MREATVFEKPETIEGWDKDYYHPVAQRYYDLAVRDLIRLIGARSGEPILDAGCGPGVHSIRVARAGCHVIAIDFSETMLREARSRVNAAGVSSQVEFLKEDLTRLSFPDGAFHHVFSWGVIIHIHDIERALDELCRVVAPGGFLALYVTNKNSLDQKLVSFARLIFHKAKARQNYPIGSGSWSELHGERIWVWYFNIPELIRQTEARGMSCVCRRIGEFSQLQVRFGGLTRTALLQLNNLCYRVAFPPGPAVANLLVFQRRK